MLGSAGDSELMVRRYVFQTMTSGAVPEVRGQIAFRGQLPVLSGIRE